jgi:hypothetical protein
MPFPAWRKRGNGLTESGFGSIYAPEQVSMSKSYVNVPMTEAEAKQFQAQDAFWTGPKLIALCAVTLAFALALLTALAWNWIGPTFNV